MDGVREENVSNRLEGTRTLATLPEEQSTFDARDHRSDHIHDSAEPDVATVIEAWPNLPSATQAGVMAMVRAAAGGRTTQ